MGVRKGRSFEVGTVMLSLGIIDLGTGFLEDLLSIMPGALFLQ